MKSKEQKRAEAILRNEEYAKLSLSQKLALLPPKVVAADGTVTGAKRQRTRLEAQLAPKI